LPSAKLLSEPHFFFWKKARQKNFNILKLWERKIFVKLIYEGKTKNVYENEDGIITLKFKDDATGKDGVFDPGENAVGLRIEGLGRELLRLSVYFFELLKEKNIPTHYISSDLENALMTVLPAKIFGNGLEFVCRRKADGSFVRRYGVEKGTDLDFLVEATIKDDARQDPPITKESLVALKIMTAAQFDRCAELTKKIAKLIAADLSQKGLELYDMKFEFGRAERAVGVEGVSGRDTRRHEGGETSAQDEQHHEGENTSAQHAQPHEDETSAQHTQHHEGETSAQHTQHHEDENTSSQHAQHAPHHEVENIMLIDEISAGCLRVYKNGEAVKPMDLARLVL
jgi:phosphoribosylaminoimidazole-succinocarboxamide synthase